MLLSMTGYGEAHHREANLAVAIEVRSVNSRYFKLSIKCSDGYGALEAEIENLVRNHIRRGTLQVNVSIDRAQASEDFQLNADVLDHYRRQLVALQQQWHDKQPITVEHLLALPGVVHERQLREEDLEQQWPLIQRVLEAALENLARMRTDEGRAMATDLKMNLQAIAAELVEIERRAPLVVESYRQRLTERLQSLLAQHQSTLAPGDVIKEISIFAERSDIAEEVVRLRSHLDQFHAMIDLPESSGRKLDFLTQEMFREANTIGSKANDLDIARRIIEVKAAIERIREMIQNVE